MTWRSETGGARPSSGSSMQNPASRSGIPCTVVLDYSLRSQVTVGNAEKQKIIMQISAVQTEIKRNLEERYGLINYLDNNYFVLLKRYKVERRNSTPTR